MQNIFCVGVHCRKSIHKVFENLATKDAQLFPELFDAEHVFILNFCLYHSYSNIKLNFQDGA